MPDMTQVLRRNAQMQNTRVPGSGRGRGYPIPPTLGQIVRDAFFEYTTPTPFAFTAGTETITQAIQIQTDAHFLVVMSMRDNSAEVNTNAQTLPTILQGGGVVQITDASAQRFLSSAPIPVSTLFGSAQRPFIWPFTHLFRAGGAISIQVTGAGAAMANSSLRLVFAGFKVPINSVPEIGL